MAITGAAKLRFRLLKRWVKNQAVSRTKIVKELSKAAQNHLKKNMSTVSGRTLANTLRSLVDLDSSSDDLEKLLEATVKELRDRPDAFNTQERCMIVGTLAAQRLFPGHIINESVNRVRFGFLLGFLLYRSSTYCCASGT